MSDIEEKFKLQFDRKLAYRNLTEKMNSRLCIAHQGGLWKCDREFISFLNAFQNSDELVVIDMNDVPRKVNVQELLHEAKGKYTEVTNDWMVEWDHLRNIRSVDNALIGSHLHSIRGKP